MTLNEIIPATLTALLTTLATGLAAAAATNCAPHDAVVNQLAQSYGESRQSIGLGSNGAVMEVFASEETGTWTITATTPQGLTCLMASGEAYEALSEVLAKPGTKS